MNHNMEYTKLILNAKYEELMNIRKKRNSNYYERHHIVPYCFTKNNHKDNLVLLTAREHFIAHQLLIEIYRDDKTKYFKMISALDRMAHGRHKDGYQITIEEYEKLKIENSKMLSERMSGKGNSMYGKTKELAPNYRKYGKLNPMYGKTQSDFQKQRVSETFKGKPGTKWTEERKKAQSERLRMEGHPSLGKSLSEDHKQQVRKKALIRYAKKRLEENNYPNKKGYTRESDLLLISQENI